MGRSTGCSCPAGRPSSCPGADLVDDACDEDRFDKLISTPLRKVRAFTGDGLFTAWTFEPNWHKAHAILLPNFGLKAMQGYMPQMVNVAEQLVAKWSRLNPEDAIDVPEDMTRLTLDTIGLCGFDYRFNSFYRDELHPFVQAMVRALQRGPDADQPAAPARGDARPPPRASSSGTSPT